jgi:mercuric ion binding protein
MKTLRINAWVFALLAFSSVAVAQSSTETFAVSGNCGMCKKKIETAAKTAGASYAMWNKDSHLLTVKYNKATTNAARIQEHIAGAGYDTPEFKATDEAYFKLDACCQYDRKTVQKKSGCCGDACEMKDGKCKDEAACREKGCCQDSEACKAMGCCGHEGNMAAHGNMECCKKGADGKTAMTCVKGDKNCCSKKTTAAQ